MRSNWLFADFPLFQSQNTQLDPEEDLCRGCLNGIPLPLCAYCIHYMQTSAVNNADNNACFMFLLRIGAAGPFAAKEVVCRGCPQSKPRTEHYCKGCLLLE